MLSGRERMFLAYWLERAALEAPEFGEASAIVSLQERLATRRRDRRAQALPRHSPRPAARRRAESIAA
jgi:hypothetical protein